jgi:hypothetical protein
MKKLIALIWLITLSGCATKVHLITQGYQKDDIAKISQQLREKGFDVERSTSLMPNSYPSSVIAMHPAHQSALDMTTLQSFLTDNAFEVATELRFGQNSHYYNQGHVGLYLRHPNVNLNAVMPYYVESVGCKTGYATLAFQPDKTMLLETEVRINNKLELHTEYGRWLFDGSLLTITLNNNQMAQFSQRKISRETALGSKPALLYSPTTNNHQNDALKCHFEVVFIN